MGLSLLTQGSDKSQAGPLVSAMHSFGSGVQEGLASLKTAVSSYDDSQSQAVLAAFNAEFCKEAKYEAPRKKPLNFTGEGLLLRAPVCPATCPCMPSSCICILPAPYITRLCFQALDTQHKLDAICCRATCVGCTYSSCMLTLV